MVLAEPTASLDFGNQARVMQRILELSASGIGVLLSTHDPDHALIGADCVVLLHAGRILESGSAEQVITPQNLKTLYGVEVDLATVAIGRAQRKLCIPRL